MKIKLSNIFIVLVVGFLLWRWGFMELVPAMLMGCLLVGLILIVGSRAWERLEKSDLFRRVAASQVVGRAQRLWGRVADYW